MLLYSRIFPTAGDKRYLLESFGGEDDVSPSFTITSLFEGEDDMGLCLDLPMEALSPLIAELKKMEEAPFHVCE